MTKQNDSSKSASVLLCHCGLIDQSMGSGLRTLRLAKTLSAGGFKVWVLGIRLSDVGPVGYDRQYIDGVEVCRMGVDFGEDVFMEYSGSLVREFEKAARLVKHAVIYGRLARQFRADIVTIVSGHPLFQLATLATLRRDSKLVIDFQDIVYQGSAVMRNWPLTHPMIRALRTLELYEVMRANGVVTVGWTIGDGLRSTLGAKSVFVYPNSFFPNEFERLEQESSLVQNNTILHLEDSEKIKFVYLGRLDPGSRGLENLLEVMMNLPPRQAREMLFLFIGDGRLLDSIRTASKRMTCEIIVTGMVPRKLAFALLKRSDVALLPYPPDALSLVEMRGALPSKVFEYTYFGLPVVMPDLPDARLVAGELAVVYHDWIELKRILVSYVSEGLRAPKDIDRLRKRLIEMFLGESLNRGLVSFFRSIIAPLGAPYIDSRPTNPER